MSYKVMQNCRWLVLALAFGWAVAVAAGQTPPPLLEVKPNGAEKPAETLKLVKIEFAGLSKRAPDVALAVCGLQIGQTITQDDIEQAAQRLSDTGWFKKLGYRMKGPSTEAITLTFTLEEDESPNIPVFFDNFVALTDEEITDLLRANGIFGFDGTLPEGSKTPDLIVRILEKEFAKRRQKGRIEYELLASEGNQLPRLIFRVTGARLPICALAFPGANKVAENLLQNAASELLSQDYSRYTALYVARYKLRPLYRQRGYWRVQFGAANAQTLAGQADCAGGVRLSVPVTEGPQFVWDALEWTGNTAYQPPELNAALALKTGETADESKFDLGLRELNQLYQRKGYLELLVSVKPLFNDAQKRLGWRLSLVEGPQYRMGKLTINNLPPADVQALLKEWQLKPGDVYDASYLNTFITATLLPRLAQLGPALQGRKIMPKPTPDKQKTTVDITIDVVADDKPPVTKT